MKEVVKSLLANRHDFSVLEYVSPYKICVAIFLDEFCSLKSPKAREWQTDPAYEFEEIFYNSYTFEPIQRKDFCKLILKLMQNVDAPLSELADAILNSSTLNIHPALKACWKRRLAGICSDPISELLVTMSEMEKTVFSAKVVPLLHRASVSGLFLRRLILGFEKLSFSEVSNLALHFKDYCFEGLNVIAQHEELDDPKISFLLTEVVHMLKALIEEQQSHQLDQTLELASVSEEAKHKEISWTRRQCDLYVSKQVELLQISEAHADSAPAIEKVVASIMQCHPDLPQAQYLSYLNALRINDFCAAVKSLYWSFDRSCQSESFLHPDLPEMSEETDRGFRYAALNLAALHARFNHKAESMNVLKEAIMMAQEANDHHCLQHALTWLFRVQPKQENKQFLLQRCVSKCQTLGLSYLTTLGIQTLAQVVAMSTPSNGKTSSPAVVMDILSKSDLVNCQHSLVEMILNSYAQKSAFWTMFGRGHLASVTAQLLLNLDSSGGSSQRLYNSGEAVAIGLTNVAKRCWDLGKSKESDLILEYAKSLFPRESSICGAIWKSVQVHIEFQRSLNETDWTNAEQSIKSSLAFAKHPSEPLFLQLQLFVCQGKDLEASEVCHKLSDLETELSALDKVRFYLHQAEVFCLSGHYADAIFPLMSAMKTAAAHNLDFMHALVTLHTAHIQLQLGMASRALKTTQSCLAAILGHGSLFECSRARVLFAKCLVASSNKDSVSIFKSISHLRSAYEGFMLLRAHHRAKDVLYLMARLYHVLEEFHERNQVSAELKRLENQYPTNGPSQLAIML